MNSTEDCKPVPPDPQTLPSLQDLPDDPRLLQAVQEYLEEMEAGRRPNRADFLLRYTGLAEPLARCLDGLDLVHHAAARQKGPLTDSGSQRKKALDPLPANPLGDFQILREIGRGGMGIVYEAVQLSLGRRVALKVLPFAATFDAKYLQRFRNEAHAAAQLHHPNIVPEGPPWLDRRHLNRNAARSGAPRSGRKNRCQRMMTRPTPEGTMP